MGGTYGALFKSTRSEARRKRRRASGLYLTSREILIARGPHPARRQRRRVDSLTPRRSAAVRSSTAKALLIREFFKMPIFSFTEGRVLMGESVF